MKKKEYVIKRTANERKCYAVFLFIPMIISYFLVFNHCMSTATLAEDLKKAYGTDDIPITDQQIANFASIYFYLYGFLQVVVGITVDNVGTHLSMGISNVIVAIGTYIIGLVHDINIALFGRALVAIGCAFVYIPICKWIAVWWPKHNFPLLVAISLVFGYGGSYCSTVPQKEISKALGFKNTFILYGSISLVCGVIILIAGRNFPMQLGFPSPTIDDEKYEIKKKEKENRAMKEAKDTEERFQIDGSHDDNQKLNESVHEEHPEKDLIPINTNELETVIDDTVIKSVEIIELKKEENKIPDVTEATNKQIEATIVTPADDKKLSNDSIEEKKDEDLEEQTNLKQEATTVSIKMQFTTVFGIKENRKHVLCVTFSHFFFMAIFFTMSASFGPRYLRACLPALAVNDPDDKIGVTQSIITICCIFGAATSFLWADYIGRKVTQIIAMCIYVIVFGLQIMFSREKFSSIAAFSVLNAFTGYFAVVGVGCSYTHIKDKIDAKMAGVALGLHNMAMFISGAILQQAAAPQLIKDTMTIDEKRNGATYMAIIFFICAILALTLMCLTKETHIGEAFIACKKRKEKKLLNKKTNISEQKKPLCE